VTDPDPVDGEVRWPALAVVGVVLAVVTVVGAIAVAVIAAFFVDTDDPDPSSERGSEVIIWSAPVGGEIHG